MVTAAGAPDRTIAFDAVFNFRDLGGYAGRDGREVKWRTLFRADGLNRLTDEEIERVQALGVTTVIDLRTPDEIAARGRFPAVADVAYHHLPLFDVVPDWTTFTDAASPRFLAERYVDMLDSGRGAVAAVLGLLAEPANLPAVFHCAAGKDRTGIVASIVLSLLGVHRATVAEDYALSHAAMARFEDWITARNPEWASSAATAARPRAVMEARPETIVDFLAAVDARHGSVLGLVEDLGVTPAEVMALQANLLD